MDKDNFTELITDIVPEIQILKYERKGDESFNVSFQCKLDRGDNQNEKCDNFIKRFSEATKTNWIMQKIVSKSVRFEYRKRYVCHHSSRNKNIGKTHGSLRNYSCLASISIKFLKQTTHTLKKSKALKKGLNVLIEINYDHSHLVRVAQAFSLLRCTEDTKNLYHSYFDAGMTPAAAKTYHEINMAESLDAKSLVTSLANAQVNPTEQQINYLYKKWRKNKYGDREMESTFDLLKKRQEEIGKEQLHLDEHQKIVVIVTPIMRRIFQAGLTNDIVFIDSSGSCDQTNSCVTFVFAPTKIGAVPVAVALHTSQTEMNYLLVFKAMKETLEKDSDMIFNPNIIMTDDSSAERNALSVVFPQSTLLLCIFHVTQALWRWLWSRENHVCKEERQRVMYKFRQILFSDTEDIAINAMEELSKCETVINNEKLKKHLNKLWERRKEWCLAFRSQLLNRGHNTNNFCEASIRIFKDVVLQRCKAFNMCALVDFIIKTFESYHKKRLLNFANSRSRSMTLMYENFQEKSKNIQEITKINDCTFEVTNEIKSESYTVDSETATCSCSVGQSGRFCKHMCAVEARFGVFFKCSLLINEGDRHNFAQIAVGNDIPTDFFKNIISDDSGQQVEADFQMNDNCEILHEEVAFNRPIDLQLQSEFNTKADKLNSELIRIGQVIKNDIDISNINHVSRFLKTLENLQTPSQVLSFVCDKNLSRRSCKIKVQPTSISRRKDRGLTGGRIQSGRPSTAETSSTSTKKRRHNISMNIKNNEPVAKKH